MEGGVSGASCRQVGRVWEQSRQQTPQAQFVRHARPGPPARHRPLTLMCRATVTGTLLRAQPHSAVTQPVVEAPMMLFSTVALLQVGACMHRAGGWVGGWK